MTQYEFEQFVCRASTFQFSRVKEGIINDSIAIVGDPTGVTEIKEYVRNLMLCCDENKLCRDAIQTIFATGFRLGCLEILQSDDNK